MILVSPKAPAYKNKDSNINKGQRTANRLNDEGQINGQ